MSDDEDRRPRVHLRGRKIEFASTTHVDAFPEIAHDFMFGIFALMPGEYLISDESRIADFVKLGPGGTEDRWRDIRTRYGFGRSDVNSDRLIDIFIEIDRRRNPH